MEAIVTPAEMAAIDAAAPEPVAVLIDRAAAAVARAALEMLGGGYGRRVVIVADKGNNGLDGRVAGDRLRRRGVRVTVVEADRAPGTLPPADLVIDAAYGTGFRGTYDFPELADPTTPVLAVDIPSGVEGLTGEASGRPARAVRTVTFAALKPGLLLGDGPGLAGAVAVADIGLDVASARAWLVDGAAVRSWLPEPERETHKWRSAVWIIAGSPGMTGAAALAARGAQRCSAGYVRLSAPGSAGGAPAPREVVRTELPASGWAEVVAADDHRFGSLVIGPGLGTSPAVADEVRTVVAGTARPCVVDGDGLRALGPSARAVIAARPASSGPVILTPHDGEYEALTGASVPNDRFAAVRELAAATSAVVLLKGPTTLVAGPDGRVLVVTSGDARLATAGTGDVLAGAIGALLAQGLAGPEAAAAAGHLHGRAGALAWDRGLVAGDVAEHLVHAFAELPGG